MKTGIILKVEFRKKKIHPRNNIQTNDVFIFYNLLIHKAPCKNMKKQEKHETEHSSRCTTFSLQNYASKKICTTILK